MIHTYIGVVPTYVHRNLGTPLANGRSIEDFRAFQIMLCGTARLRHFFATDRYRIRFGQLAPD